MKRLFYIILLICCGQNLWAQQDPQFTMNMFNRQVMNPGFVGSVGATQITFCSRTQWVGIDGHPTTFTLGVHAPVPFLRGGLGLHLVNDAIGPFSTTGIRLAYAFRIPIGSNGAALQLGINPGIYLRQLDATNFRSFQQETDPALSKLFAQRVNQNNFDIGAGAYFHIPSRDSRNEIDKFYVGASLDHITEPKMDKWSGNASGSPTVINRHLMFMGGYRFGNGAICFVPNIFYKWALGTEQMQLDIVGNLHVKPMVFGIGYRGLRNVSELMALMGFHANQRLFIAYSYDYTISGLSVATSGSHEVIVQYTFPKVVRFYPPDLDVKQNPILR
jgi:type IX secretion system PorP/SprF family membrane protein